MGELAPVVTVDGRPIGDGDAGPMTRRLSELFRERTATEGDRVALLNDAASLVQPITLGSILSAAPIAGPTLRRLSQVLQFRVSGDEHTGEPD